MTDLTNLTIASAKNGLASGEFSASELTKAHLDAIEAKNKDLNAYTFVQGDVALEQAKASETKIKNGNAGALEGIPLGIKDLFCTKGMPSTAASKILDGFVPPYESTVSQNLLNAGATFLGKLNMDEFAMGSANITSAYGNVKNPIRGKQDRDLVPGGSSGGSSAAIAASMCLGATGTDTGGSIRQPAAFTGIVGMKPTYGRCSRYGIVAFASSLDQAGPMAKTVEDCALMLNAMAGFDERDSTSAQVETPDFNALIGQDIKGLKVGIPDEYQMDGMDDDIVSLWKDGETMLKDTGAEVVSVSLPHTKYALPTYYIIAPAECSSNLARYDGVKFGKRTSDEGDTLIDMYEKTRSAGFGDEVKRRIMIGTYVLSAGYYDAYYRKAQRVRTLISNDFKSAFEKCDVILTPTTPTAAFGIGEKQDDPITMYLNDVFTVPTSLAGLPGMSVPIANNADELPLGLQLIAPAFAEQQLFKVGHVLEQQAGFRTNSRAAKAA